MSADLSPEVSVVPVKRKAGRPAKPKVTVTFPEPVAAVEVAEQVQDEVAEPQRAATAREIVEATKRVAAGEELEDVYATIVHDPFSRKNPMDFKAHPRGKRLYWANPTFRDRYGMRGLVFVSYDSPIGRDRDKYLVDSPTKMATQTDNLIRRGDTILAYIPYGIWKYRQLMRDSKAGANLRDAAAHGQETYAGSGQSFGTGLRIDKNHKNAVLDDEVSSANSITRLGHEMPREGEGR